MVSTAASSSAAARGLPPAAGRDRQADADTRSTARMGRFRLLRRLGEGAQATVWLAHDPRLDRPVALKLLNPSATDLGADAWLHEARAVARLHHPHIVPVFEADLHEGQRYLVFEYVPGGTLTQRLAQRGRLPAREAVELMLGLLEALQLAHAAGVVHRDLKPSNILVDEQGRARVMDFGIAARLAQLPDDVTATDDGREPQAIVGTPAYLSPEAARGEPPCAAMDVFAAAALLAELLTGRRVNPERDPWRAVQRVSSQDLAVPPAPVGELDDALRAVVQRGLARRADLRWPSAQAFHEALVAWLHPDDAGAGNGAPSGTRRHGGAGPAVAAGDGATLDFLLRRMRTRSDFPAMSSAVGRIQKLTYSDKASLRGLSNEILEDVALTQKLLRLVNTAHYRHAGGGSISTVSRAVALVGFAGIRNLTLSLILLEHMENKGHAQQLREEFLRSLMAAQLARELCADPRLEEEAFLSALFHNLGRTLAEFYFPDEAAQVRRLVRPERKAHGLGVVSAPVSEASASARVLGMSYDQLGQGVARHWGLPPSLQQSMRHAEGEPPHAPPSQPAEQQRWLAHLANGITELMLQHEPEEARPRVQALAHRHARAIGLRPEGVHRAVEEARQHLTAMAQAMAIGVAHDAPAQRLLVPAAAPPDEDAELDLELATLTLRPPAATARAAGDDATQVLGARPAPAAPSAGAAPSSAAAPALPAGAAAAHAARPGPGAAAAPTHSSPAAPAAAAVSPNTAAASAHAAAHHPGAQRPNAHHPRAYHAGAHHSGSHHVGAHDTGDHHTGALQPRHEDAAAHDRVVAVLTAGIEDVTNALVENIHLNEVLRRVLHTVHDALGFRRVLFCLREPRSECLLGRFGLGEGTEAGGPLLAAFRIPLRPPVGTPLDLFTAVCQRGLDTCIADSTEPRLAQRLPAWYRDAVAAPSFLLLPLVMKGATFGLIYADKDHAGALDLAERELALLRTLRNQAVMAFKQAG